MARCLQFAILFMVVLAALLQGQAKYAGSRPPRKNTPYLVHADTLVETEFGTAEPVSTKKDVTTYVIAGEKSAARTPLASPVLVIESAGMDVEKLQLFRVEIKNGHREVNFHSKGKSGAVPLRINIERVSGNLYRIEVVDSLPAGEYTFSPDGTNDVFCFAVS